MMSCCRIGLIPCKEKQKFELKSLSVDCGIRNLLVSCTSEFVYKNDENEDVEALFSFPLDNNCVVYDFKAVMGNKTIIGVCKEVEEAKNMYKVAKEMGHMAAMIERNTSMTDVFKCRIGNFPKNSEAKIILKFAMELKLSLARSEVPGVDRLNLALPLILNPRYTPSAYEGDREVYQVTNKYEYQFKATIHGTKVIRDVSAVNHILGITYTDDKKTNAQVTLQSEYDGTKDLDINIDYEDMREPSVYYELGTKSSRYSGPVVNGAFYQPDVAMVNFLPKFNVEEQVNRLKTEIVFIVDRSGSMEGSNIERARECLLIFLKSLPMDCKFQIYGFGSTFDKAFNDSQLYSDQSITTAMRYQKNLRADFGGTELMQPLQDMYNSPLGSDYTRVAFVLTDGDVGNQDEVTSLVRKHNTTTRLFTVGIGDGVSTSLVDQVARSGLGKSAFVRNAKELSASVIELLDMAINSTPFTDAKVEWQCPPHVSIVSVPSSTPPIFSDYFLTIFCMINGLKENDVINCTLTGKVNGQPTSFVLNINDSQATVDEEFRVHRLLAKYKIDEMTTQINDGQNDLKKTLIDMSTEVNIVTNWTTFVAIDQDAPNAAVTGPELEPDYGMMMCDMAAPMMCRMSAPKMVCNFLPGAPPPPMMKAGGAMAFSMSNNSNSAISMESESMCFDGVDGPAAFGGRAEMDMDDEACEEKREIEEDLDIVMYLASKQNINGSWMCEDKLIEKMGLDVGKLKNKKPQSVSDEIWITVVVYQYLTTKEKPREKEWRLFAKKAKQWIDNHLPDPNLSKQVIQACGELLQ